MDGEDAASQGNSTTNWGEYFGREGDVYQMLDLVGRGSSGVVRKCRRVRTNTYYAVKLIDLSQLRLRSDAQERRVQLLREVQILARLKHEYIVNLQDCIETNDTLFLVMELVCGGDLFDSIIKSPGGRLPEERARAIFIQLCSAVQYLHLNDVIHRDIKIENVRIEMRIDMCTPKMSDHRDINIGNMVPLMNTNDNYQE